MISVVVPVYKVEHYLKNCIESVRNQSLSEWELILVDDGSPDNCGQICDDYARLDERIKVIHKENGGQAQARNRALDISKGDYVTFLDSDDYLHPDYLNYLLSVAKINDADIVQCDFTKGVQTDFPQIRRPLIEKIYNNHSVFLEGKANIIVWGKLYKRNIVLKNRIKEGKYYEDDFTTWKWYYNAKRIVVSNKVLYYYTENPTSTMAQHAKKPSFDFLEAYNERIQFFVHTKEEDLEHCSRLQLCKALTLCYSNSKLNKEERKVIIAYFKENWKELRYSPFISFFNKVIFFLFNSLPRVTSIIANKIK